MTTPEHDQEDPALTAIRDITDTRPAAAIERDAVPERVCLECGATLVDGRCPEGHEG